MASYNEPVSLIEQDEDFHSRKHYISLGILIAVFAIGILVAVNLGRLAPTFNGKVDVAALQADPAAYSTESADGAASVIVSENLAKTNALNVCFSVVFNFRGYDTMGESFILIAALAGSLCILRNPRHGGELATPAEKTGKSKKRGRKGAKLNGEE